MVDGLICAGKKIHEALIQADNEGAENLAVKYVEECQIMADLRHPHVALFLGVCFLGDSSLPVLVIEKLDCSLDDLLENVANIPLALKRSMLEDVALTSYIGKRKRDIVSCMVFAGDGSYNIIIRTLIVMGAG